ncbi:Zn(2+)-responsive transcriptional regulator [Marinicella rhabdoformis]|uniref:Zn(2+)-responsive transcriptional regulator n=1 Tax=Marinicella rhabdoformis TaxID=2580566 RepID=UPI0012AEDA01|nr:Zn(2+)-responsive transcriptional regulator [Marinicella rhabdoformis]
MKIGEFAQTSQVSADTIRYYEKIDLLKPSQRSASGYRLYSSQDLETLRFIRSAQSLGMSLETIKQLLAIQLNKQAAHCEDVKRFVGKQLKDLDARIDELVTMRTAMGKLHEACCGGDEVASCCSILQALESGDV